MMGAATGGENVEWNEVREGDAVEAKWSGEWWPATVVQASPPLDNCSALVLILAGKARGQT